MREPKYRNKQQVKPERNRKNQSSEREPERLKRSFNDPVKKSPHISCWKNSELRFRHLDDYDDCDDNDADDVKQCR